MAQTLEDLRGMMMDEIKEIVKEDSLDSEKLEQLYKMIDIIKDVDEVHMNGMGEDGYSQAMRPNMWNGGMYYDGGNSYQKRDSMGRYSRDMAYRGNSYRGGYSREGERDQMIQKLERMMDEAQTDREREAIRRCIDSM